MRRHFIAPLLALASLCASLSSKAADAPDASQNRLRDALRAASAQLAAVQNERDALQITVSDSDQKAKTATARADALVKQGIADRAASDKLIAGLEARLAAQATELSQVKESLDKVKAAFQQASGTAKDETAERERQQALVLALRRQANDDEAKNLALFKTANEILIRYENFSLGNALASKEPFVGLTRVKLENLVQGYQDQLMNQRIAP